MASTTCAIAWHVLPRNSIASLRRDEDRFSRNAIVSVSTLLSCKVSTGLHPDKPLSDFPLVANIAASEEQRHKKKDIESIAQKSSSHAQAVDREAAETAEMHAAITSITKQRDARAQHRDRIRNEIASTRKQVAQKITAQQQYAKEVDAHAQSNGPELDFWQSYLGMRIEGVGIADRLKFVFTCVDERNWEREAWFDLDMGGSDYQVVNVKPRVEAEGVEGCLERLNESRDFGQFLKGMRGLFVAAIK